MSVSPQQSKTAPLRLDQIGAARVFNAYVVGVAFLKEGWLAAALGDGRVAFITSESADPPRCVSVHDGACLSLAADLGGNRVLTGGDDGCLASTDTSGRIEFVTAVPGQWVEPLAVSPVSGLRAAAVGKTVLLFAQEGALVASFEHANSVGGLAFDPKGRRLAAAHYGGVSLWWAIAGKQEPRRLAWPGSHLQLTWSPDGKYIVTAMQENELHGWRLSDDADIRMSGYPSKVKSMAWLPKGRYLATSGAEAVVCWPFHGKGGLTGKPPLDLGGSAESVVTVVAAHPRHHAIAAGYEDGATLVMRIDRPDPVGVKRPGKSAVTALAWSADGQHLAVGTESGFVGCFGVAASRSLAR
jgi:WD40 repeat protein